MVDSEYAAIVFAPDFKTFLRMPLGHAWRHLAITHLAFAVSVLFLASCASNRRPQQRSPDKSFFDTPDAESLH